MTDEAIQQVYDKFRPWFPPFRTDPLPVTSMKTMTFREALAIVRWQAQCLYDGSSGNGPMFDHALGTLEYNLGCHWEE